MRVAGRARPPLIVGVLVLLLASCRPLTADPLRIVPLDIGEDRYVALGPANANGLAMALVVDPGSQSPISPGLVDLEAETIIELPGLGGDFEQPSAINDAGVVVGMVRTPDGDVEPAIWDPEKGYQLELFTAVEGDAVSLFDIGNDGIVIGGIRDDQDGSAQAFAHDLETGQTTILPTAGSDDFALRLASSGLVLGWTETAEGDGRTFVHQLGSASSELLPHPVGFTDSHGEWVDDSGALVVGHATDTNRRSVMTADSPSEGPQYLLNATIWDLTTGEMTVLDPFGGGYSQATGANEDGIVVGSSRTTDGVDHGFAYDTTTGKLLDLGVWDGHGLGDVGGLWITDDLLVTGFGEDWSHFGEGISVIHTPLTTELHLAPHAPGAPRVTGCAGEVVVDWEPPDFDGNDAINSYTVLGVQNGTVVSAGEMDASVRSWTDAGAPPGSVSYRVIATNSLGGSPASEPTTIDVGPC